MLNSAFIFIVSLTFIAVLLLPILQYCAVEKTSNLYIRVKAWCWMLAVLSLVIGLSSLFRNSLLGQAVVPAFTLLICLLGSREILLACHLKAKLRGALLLLVATIQITAFWLPMSVISSAMIGLILVFWCVLPKHRFPSWRAKGLAVLVLTVLSMAMLSPIILMRNMALMNFLSLFIYLLFAIQFNDISQYICGMRFGKRLLAPVVSPNKTVEGAIGGVILSCSISIPAGITITEFNLATVTVVSVLASSMGIVGDLCVSWLKRFLGIKDFGEFISGHGGMMDRVDSLLFSLPLCSFFIAFIFFWGPSI